MNALDAALRKDLGKYQRFIEDLELVDFRVRILNGGTGAVTRVLIESRDRAGETWTTVGVSANIIDASFQALTDSHHLQAGEGRRGVCEGLSPGHALGGMGRVAHADHHNSVGAGLVEDQIGKRGHDNPAQPWNVGALSGVGVTCDEVDRRPLIRCCTRFAPRGDCSRICPRTHQARPGPVA